MPKIQDKNVFWAKATKKPILKAWMLTWQMCVCVLAEWKIALRSNNTKARF